MTTDDAGERAELTREISAIQEVFETSALPAMLDPLLSMELTIQQLKVMMILVTSEEAGTGQSLARALGVSLATMSGVLDRLAAHGMIERVEDERDHRVRRVLATPLGRRTVHSLVSTQPQFDRDPLEQLALDDLRALAQGLRAVLRVLSPEPPVSR